MSKKSEVKAKIDKHGIVTFLNDSDGVTERDWLILLTSVVFFGGIGLGLFVILTGMFFSFDLPPIYIDLIQTMSAPIGVILGGLFAVKGVQTWKDGKKESYNEEDDI